MFGLGSASKELLPLGKLTLVTCIKARCLSQYSSPPPPSSQHKRSHTDAEENKDPCPRASEIYGLRGKQKKPGGSVCCKHAHRQTSVLRRYCGDLVPAVRGDSRRWQVPGRGNVVGLDVVQPGHKWRSCLFLSLLGKHRSKSSQRIKGRLQKAISGLSKPSGCTKLKGRLLWGTSITTQGCFSTNSKETTAKDIAHIFPEAGFSSSYCSIDIRIWITASRTLFSQPPSCKAATFLLLYSILFLWHSIQASRF